LFFAAAFARHKAFGEGFASHAEDRAYYPCRRNPFLGRRTRVKPFYIVLGCLAFALGSAGIFLPLLPTVPLYLLAAFCLTRGSARLHRRFVNSKLYKNYAAQLQIKHGLTLRIKLRICLPVSVCLAVSIIFVPLFPIKLLIAALLLAKWAFFFFYIPTLRGVSAREDNPVGS
jgi:uncharacterized membrane protein YbaN (DUF454 family)